VQTAVSSSPAADTPSRIRTEVTASAGIVVSVAAAALVLAGPGHGPALAGALLLACVPAGTAVMCWVDSGDGVLQAGLTLVLSLAVTAIVSVDMIWLKAWHPDALLAVAAASVLSCGVRLWRVAGTASLAGLRAGMGIRAARPTRSDLTIRLAPLFGGLGAWAYGLSQIRPGAVGMLGLLADANVWFLLGLAALLAGALLELARPEPRTWLLGAYLASLIVAIYATVPILYTVPEYGWVYKHIGIAQALGTYGRVTDPSNIYQQWPAFFAAVASVSRLSRFGPLSFAAWGPLAFELADALLLAGIFRLVASRMMAGSRRIVWLALFLYEGLMAWVGQDYLSPQAFGYLLWLGIAAIFLRWLLAPAPPPGRRGAIGRARAFLAAGRPAPPKSAPAAQWLALALIAVLYFAIVAAHQLTPYFALLAVGSLVILGLLRRGWLLLLMLVVIAGGYLIPHYDLISQSFGGLFSGGNVLQNASGVGVYHPGAEATTAQVVRGLAIGMWLLTLAAIALRWRAPGRVAAIAALAFSPFFIILVQDYGGEAIYRVYMFSLPWCALLIAGMLAGLPPVLRRSAAALACLAALAAGLQGLYGPVSVDSFTPAELTASLWLYAHAPRGSVLVVAADNFPGFETADYNDYDEQVIPADPQFGVSWLDESNMAVVEQWLASFGHHDIFVVFSHSMAAYTGYFGAPHGYAQLAQAAQSTIGWSVVYRTADTTIYRVSV
jgi:hypothetical protein